MCAAILTDRAALIGELKARSIPYRETVGLGGLQLTLFEHTTDMILC